jgi:hypothetical protein
MEEMKEEVECLAIFVEIYSRAFDKPCPEEKELIRQAVRRAGMSVTFNRN